MNVLYLGRRPSYAQSVLLLLVIIGQLFLQWLVGITEKNLDVGSDSELQDQAAKSLRLSLKCKTKINSNINGIYR